MGAMAYKITGLTGEFPAQMASNAENVSILMSSSCLKPGVNPKACFIQVRYLMRGINSEKLGLKCLNVGKYWQYEVYVE